MNPKNETDLIDAYDGNNILYKTINYALRLLRQESTGSVDVIPSNRENFTSIGEQSTKLPDIDGVIDKNVGTDHVLPAKNKDAINQSVFTDMSNNSVDLSSHVTSLQTMYNIEQPYKVDTRSPVSDGLLFDTNEMALSETSMYAIGTIVSASLIIAVIFVSGIENASSE